MVGGSQEATRAFLTGSQRGLDDRGLEPNPTKCEYIPVKTLPQDIRAPEAPAGWKVRYDKCFALGAAFGHPDFCLRKLQEKLDRAERLATQLVRLRSLATAHGARSAPVRFSRTASTFVPSRCRPPSRISLVESSESPSHRTLGTRHKGGFDIIYPVLHSPAAVLSSSYSFTTLTILTCSRLTRNAGAAPRRTLRGVRTARHAPRATCPTCATHGLLDGAWLVGGANSPLSPSHPLLGPRFTVPPCAAKSSIAFVITSLSAHVPETATAAHVFSEAQEAGLRPQKEKAGLLQPLQRASHDRPADVWIFHRKDMIPEAVLLQLPFCFWAATRNPGPTSSSTQNLAEYETLKRTLHGLSTERPPLHSRSFRWTRGRLWRLRPHSSPGSPTDFAPLLSAHQATSISNWLNASFRHFSVTPSVPFCDVSGWPRKTPP